MNQIKLNRRRGFTLIELLVVIAIIGLLSSIVLASLTAAREKAKASAITQEMNQMRSEMFLNYGATGTGYNNLVTSAWIVRQADCDTYIVTGPSTIGTVNATEAAKMSAICKKIVAIVNPKDLFTAVNNYPPYSILIGNPAGNPEKFSINIWHDWYNGNLIYCMGSNGKSYFGLNTAGWTHPGCYSDPNL